MTRIGRYTVIVAAVICAADAPYLGAQTNSKEIMAQSPARLVDMGYASSLPSPS